MKIRSLRLEHFRKFTDPVVLAGFTGGVNVLAEGNEFGKSTLLAAIRGVLFERHVSKAASVVAMQHHTNKTSPVISLEFELPTGLYRIEKRFLHKEPYARLTLPDGTVHHGEAAEEQLQRILNFTQAGKTGSKADNVGMWRRFGSHSETRSISPIFPIRPGKPSTAVWKKKWVRSPVARAARPCWQVFEEN